MIQSTQKFSNYRWVMMALCVLALLGQTLTWLAPAPLLAIIMAELDANIGQAGSLLTIITLVTGIFAFAGSFFVDKLGVKITMILGLLFFGLGGTASLLTHSYYEIFAARFVVGLGFGMTMPIIGVVVSSWFPPKEQPYINSVVIVVSYFGMLLAYTILLPIYEAVGTWQKTLASIGLYVIAVGVLWLVFGKGNKSTALEKNTTIETQTTAPSVKKESGLKQAARRREVWLLALMLLGVMWTFNTFTAYLSLYFQEIREFSPSESSSITGALPLAGVFGAIICGVASAVTGLRKPFTWPLFLLMIMGGVGAVMIPDGPLLYLSVGLIGFGAAGFSPVFLQVPMELKDSSPEMVGGALAIIIGTSYIISYFSSMLFGQLSSKVGLAVALIVFASSMLISLIASLLLKETGPSQNPEGKAIEISA